MKCLAVTSLILHLTQHWLGQNETLSTPHNRPIKSSPATAESSQSPHTHRDTGQSVAIGLTGQQKQMQSAPIRFVILTNRNNGSASCLDNQRFCVCLTHFSSWCAFPLNWQCDLS